MKPKTHQEPKCNHAFELSKVTEEPMGGTYSTVGGDTNFFWKKFGYSVCTKCGLIIRTEI